jgi:hypothetical protein
MAFLPNTAEDRRKMLEVIGVQSQTRSFRIFLLTRAIRTWICQKPPAKWKFWTN